ncbi:hypothetical protein PpBr36_04728 [Pyricularia pennisetigena]|uniref:hypothetical protein n=1 Tax=Pyricularia pennisetigena TaxID=1578925 RepID=UPI0011519AFE|nr:hypothetical protein PpBr36_04728 [Pyricularia pennisetigena]TLS26265.1 hypothetical protein PpBr36_04728 [Pyricularia pennisetigena]
MITLRFLAVALATCLPATAYGQELEQLQQLQQRQQEQHNLQARQAIVTTSCHDYQLFIARGSDEPYPGRAASLIRDVCGKLTKDGKVTCGYEDIIFNANVSSAPPPAYCVSTAEGSANGQQQMKTYASRCKDSNLILIGYSQGGIVAQDVMGGGGGPLFECDQATNGPFKKTESPGSQIVAALTFGSVRHTPNQPFSFGPGSAFPGVRPRDGDQLKNLKEYEDRYRDWCNSNDPICAVGSKPVIVANHLNYFEVFAEEAATWLAETAVKNSKQKSGGGGDDGGASKSSSAVDKPTGASAAETASSTGQAGSVTTPTAGPQKDGGQKDGGQDKPEEKSGAGRSRAEPLLASALCVLVTFAMSF